MPLAPLQTIKVNGSPDKDETWVYALGSDFADVLPWGLIDNRPYLRCLHGYGLCLWKFKRFDEAAAVFSRMLWMNPSDNQGARFNLFEVRARTAWEDCEHT